VKMVHDLIRRQNATAATLAKFRGKRFDWKAGRTCVHLARFHLRAMGHKLPKVPPIRSALGARRALDANGWRDAGDMLRGIGLEEIVPGRMLLGDLIVYEQDGDHGLGAIAVQVAPFKTILWADWAGETLATIDFDRSLISRCFRV